MKFIPANLPALRFWIAEALTVFANGALSGCATLDRDLAKGLPKGTWKSVDATVTGKFSATKIGAIGVVNDGKVITAEELHIRHSNVWVPLI